MVMVGMGFEGIAGTVAYFAVPGIPWLIGLYGVGFVLPGLIAQDMERQGVWRTVFAVLITAGDGKCAGNKHLVFIALVGILVYFTVTHFRADKICDDGADRTGAHLGI